MQRLVLDPSLLPPSHARAVVSGLARDPFVAGNLLESLLRLHPTALAAASALLASSPTRSAFMWNTLIRAHLANSLPSSAATLFADMLRSPTKPNHFTFPLALKAFSQLQSLKEGRTLHSSILKLGFDADFFVQASLVHFYGSCRRMVDAQFLFDSIFEPKVSSWTALLSGYAKAGDLGAARIVFDEMPHRHLVSWSAMISGYVNGGNPLEGLALFRKMMVSKVKPNSSVLVGVLVAIAELGVLQEGRWVHAYIERSDVDWSPNLRTSLVNMYSKCGDVTSARQFFDRTRGQKAVDLWNAMITGLGVNGRGKEALELFDAMVTEGLKPDDMTFIGVLCGCSHTGLVSEGRACFEDMSQAHGLLPKVEHYSCMVDLLGRAGLLREALEFIKNMPVAANGRVWGSLFGACRIHGDVELGETVGKLLIQLEPDKAGRYVLLANLYASTGRWKDAADVREAMKRRGVELEPGCSLIEVNGTVHEFLVGDRRHPRTKEIYSMLDDSAKLLSSRGYVPSTKHVLFDISEEEKEGVLIWHSEKLAIAFGLISAGPGEVIRIVKNLRICGDCHSMAKFVSQVYDHEIVIRDRSRFHHFSHGSCSCLDYW